MQLRRLKSYADRKLGALAAHDRLTVRSLADSVLGRECHSNPFGGEPLPSFLWSRPSGNYIYLELIPKACSHTYSEARVTIFGDNGVLVSDVKFQTGYKLDVVDAARITLSSSPEFLFAIDSIPSGGPIDFSDGRYVREKEGRGIRKQYYAIIDNQPVLLRLEGLTGNSMPNGVDHSMIGPELAGNHFPDLIDRLKSELAGRAEITR